MTWRDQRFPLLFLFILCLATAAEAGVTATASSGAGNYDPRFAVDGNRATRWSSEFSDPQWLQVDFGTTQQLVGVTLHWETAFGADYDIAVSRDGAAWTTACSVVAGDGGMDDLDFEKVDARFLKILCKRRGTAWGFSLFEVVPKTADEPWGVGEPPDFYLREEWEFRRAGDNAPPCSGDGWAKIRTHDAWNRQGHTCNAGWYRSTFFIPRGWKGSKAFVELTDVHDDFELFVNGERMSGGGKTARLDLSAVLQYDARNTLCIRVRGHSGAGGILGSVLIAKSDDAVRAGLQQIRRRDNFEYFKQLARWKREGSFPYWLTDHQGFWTVVGAEGDYKESLFCQDGTVEPYKSFSVAPFLELGGELVTRTDVELAQSLERGYLPIPTVRWTHRDATLDITAFGDGEPGAATTYVEYRVRNTSGRDLSGKLYLALRPFEVNPPWQWGGLNRIHDIRTTNGTIAVNEFRLIPLTAPSAMGSMTSSDGEIIQFLEQGRLPPEKDVHDGDGFASAALQFDFSLKAGEERRFGLAIPLYAGSPVVERVDERRKAVADDWTRRLAAVRFITPDTELLDTIRASVAYLLLNRDGPAIQPGSRGYEAAWMRDGAMSSAVLLRAGFTNEVREFLDWYGRHIYNDGRVPAIVIIGRNEVNPVREYDSQGEWVYAVLQYYRFTGDRAFLARQWPSVLKALRFLRDLRQQETRDELRDDPDQRRYYGILPKCVSHEGYYPEPGNHSYWDNFWALRGWKDGQAMASVLGRTNELPWMAGEERALRAALYASISNTMEHYRIPYIPGCAEHGDFDPSATAIALTTCGELDHLPQPALDQTLEKYWQSFLQRGSPAWRGSFSPYEARIAQVFLLLNRPTRARQVLDLLMEFRRTPGWRQWPEAVYSPADHPGFIGDMPHTWAAAGFLGAARALFLYEREQDESLVLGAGIPESWLVSGNEAGVDDAATYWGPVSYRMRMTNGSIRVHLDGAACPPGGIVIRSPKPAPPGEERERRVESLPAEVEFTY